MPVDDIYSVDIHSQYQNNPNVMCFALKVTTELVPSAVVSDLIVYGTVNVEVLLVPLHVAGVTFECVTVRQIHPTTSLPDIFDFASDPGTRACAVAALPGQASMVVQLFGNKDDPTPRNRGRDFWYGQCSDDLELTADKYKVAYQTAVVAFYTTLTNAHAPASGNTYELGVFSRTQAAENIDPQFVSNGGSVPDPPTFGNDPFNQIVHIRTKGLVRTQRRRQPEDPCAGFSSADL